MITYHTIHMPSKINKLKYLRTTQLKRKINQMGFVWLYMQKMEFDGKTKINFSPKSTPFIPTVSTSAFHSTNLFVTLNI